MSIHRRGRFPRRSRLPGVRLRSSICGALPRARRVLVALALAAGRPRRSRRRAPEVLMVVHRRASSFDPRRSRSTWLFGIACARRWHKKSVSAPRKAPRHGARSGERAVRRNGPRTARPRTQAEIDPRSDEPREARDVRAVRARRVALRTDRRAHGSAARDGSLAHPAARAHFKAALACDARPDREEP